MSKEALEALELLNCGYKDKEKVCISRRCFDKSIAIIETALKEKENIEKSINELFSENGKVITTIEIKKKLKALEIIKEKRVDVSWLIKCFGFIENSTNEEECEYYNNNYEAYRNSKPLTQEEYDLLKEIICKSKI